MTTQPDGGGYALIYRSLLDHPVFRDEPEAWAFASLILRAAWKPTRVRYKDYSFVLERGQVAVSMRDLASRWGRSKNWAHRFLDRLEEAGMVDKKRDRGRDSTGTGSGTAPTVITICNYDKFQVSLNQGGTATFANRDSTGTQNNTGKERKKDNNPSVVSPSGKRATAWGDDQQMPDEWLTWATSQMGWSRSQAAAEASRFIDNALAKRRTYVDWKAAWRQWCRSPFQKTVGSKQEALTL